MLGFATLLRISLFTKQDFDFALARRASSFCLEEGVGHGMLPKMAGL